MNIAKYLEPTELGKNDCFNFVVELCCEFTGFEWDWKRPKWINKSNTHKRFLVNLDKKVKNKEYKNRAEGALDILGLKDNKDFVKVELDEWNKPGDILVVTSKPNNVDTLAIVDKDYTYKARAETGIIKIEGYPVWCYRKVK